jgi:hypothetical protein
MKTLFGSFLAVIAGIAVALVLVVGVEFFSSIVHPLPANFDGNIPEHVKRYPAWVLGVVVLAWGATLTAATWLATRIGNRVAGGVVALLLACALIFNLAMLPYAMWFKVAMLVMLPTACLYGIFRVKPRPSTMMSHGR